MNLGVAFLAGLTTGGLSCLAVQGGILTTVIVNQKKIEFDYLKRKGMVPNNRLDRLDWLPVLLFLMAKLIAYTGLGFILGALGSVISLTISIKVGFQLFAALFMFASAMNLLNVHPIFRYVVFEPPKFLRKIIRKESQANQFFTPITLGFLTIFMPCGVTQVMEVAAINSGKPIEGALIMAFFVIGTMPLFTLIGLLAAKMSEVWENVFQKVAATMLIAMSLYTLNGALIIMDAPVSTQKIGDKIQTLKAYETGQGQTNADSTLVNGIQKVEINIGNHGYTPNYFTVKMGVPVELKLKTNGAYSCANAFTMRAFNIFTQLEAKDEKTYTFTPTQKGRFTFACSMGMYTGVMEVI
jgi:uncharacterized protein